MDLSQLHDFHPCPSGLERDVQALLKRSRRERRPCERDAFLALLAGVPALRKTPGLPDVKAADYFTALPLCGSDADAAACRAHLKTVYGIKDRESLLDFVTGSSIARTTTWTLKPFGKAGPSLTSPP